ncbi:MAG: hypothetical protein H7210_01800 [Pyrinomonadaceae bacterium]|nr:hypothetical protein [Phycisphaerales bacterium]
MRCACWVVSAIVAYVLAGSLSCERKPPEPSNSQQRSPTTGMPVPPGTAPSPSPPKHAIGAFPLKASPEVAMVASAGALPLGIGPVTFFQQSCSKCHGRFGAMYAETLATTTEKKLQEDIVRMVIGPAQTRLGDAELAALVAFHRSLVKEEPFVIVTRIDDSTLNQTTIEGEASSGAAVKVLIEGKEIEAVMDEWRWRAVVTPEAGEIARGFARVTQGGKTGSCTLKSGASSHDAALPGE